MTQPRFDPAYPQYRRRINRYPELFGVLPKQC